jgi:hypothetical protein
VSKIYLRVFAGLGNQQFQYAFAKSIALKYNKQLILDCSYYLHRYHPVKEQGYPYPYKLDHFAIPEIKTDGFLRDIIGIINLRGISRRIYKLIVNKNWLFNFMPILVDQSKVAESILSGTRSIILCDYFQKNSNFECYAEEIKKYLTYQGELTESNRLYLEQIKSSKNSVSLHIRRKDYVEKSNVQNNFFYTSLEYYENSLSLLNEIEKIDKLFIFSDDIQWVKDNIILNYETVYIDNDGPDYQHQFLMSQCKNNVITNSTFSWWAAWLNGNKSKKICVPERWFADDTRADDIYIPEGWIKVKN